MRFGLISIPMALDYAAGRQTLQEVIDWDLNVARLADQAGIDEMFFAEHYTLGIEASPAPDLMIAAASQHTSRLKLGALGHLLPYHNPIALAFRLMLLDHMTGGRYIAGFAPGAYPSDAALFGTGKENPKMLLEGLDIVEAAWTKPGPYTVGGQYWTMNMPGYDESIHGPHLKPAQSPRPRMLLTGMSPNSPTLAEAGRRGYHPVSQQVNADVLANHWETYSTAAEAAGNVPSRGDWTIAREILVGDTDEDAFALARDSGLSRLWEEYMIPTFTKLGIAGLLTGGAIGVEDLTVDWLIENFFIIGSPETVAAGIRDLYTRTGGFGAIISTTHDYRHAPDAYAHHLELLAQDVKPRLADLDTAVV